jgi:hypothetical protein
MRTCWFMVVAILIAVTSTVTPVIATDVSGTISTTTWTKADTPYRVTGSLEVPSGEVLTIEAGVEVVFDTNTELIVRGALYADGTEEDGIVLRGASWLGVLLDYAESSRMSHCRLTGVARYFTRRAPIEFRGGGLTVLGSNLMLTNSTIEHNKIETDIQYVYSAPRRFWYARGGGMHLADGAVVTMDRCVIRGNRAEGGGSSVSSIGDLPSPYNFYNLGEGGGVYVGEDATLVGQNCQFIDNEVVGSGSAVGGTGVILSNCTITGNSSLRYDNEPWFDNAIVGDVLPWNSITLRNCIVWGNPADSPGGSPREQKNLGLPDWDVTYSNVALAHYDAVFAGEGNIKADPLFADAANGDLSLLPGSPSIDAGDPDGTPDTDGSRIDQGVRDGDYTVPVISVPTALHYVSSKQSDTFTIRNVGSDALLITDIMIPPMFEGGLYTPLLLRPLKHVEIPIRYVGNKDAFIDAVVIRSSDPIRSSVSVKVSGVFGTAVPNRIESGTWTSEGNPFRTIAPTEVPPSATLTVGPGVRIEGKHRITVSGSLVVNGSEDDLVYFHGENGEVWDGLHFQSGSSGLVSYAMIEDGNTPLNGGGLHISGNGTQVAFSNCTIRNNKAVRYWFHGGFQGTYGDGGGAYITDDAKVTFNGCEIASNQSGGFGVALAVVNGADVELDRCFVSDNREISNGYSGADGEAGRDSSPGAIGCSNASIRISNCTIVKNLANVRTGPGGHFLKNTAIYIVGGGFAEILNTIIWDNTALLDREIAVYPDTLAEVSYSNLRIPVSGEGNISKNPLFVRTSDGALGLQSGSPCIDAGDPTRFDPDGSRSDIGAIPYRETEPLRVVGKSGPQRFALHQNAPNPFNPSTTIRFDVPYSSHVRIDIFDIAGRHVRTLVDGILPVGSHETVWDGLDQSARRVGSGVYLYRVATPYEAETQRMLLLR